MPKAKDQIEIIYQDQDLLVISKPAGLVVNRAETVQEPTLQDWLADRMTPVPKSEWRELVPAEFDGRYGTPTEIFKRRLGLVHRLDKDTSGVLVIATNPGSLVNLLAQFKQRQVEKRYKCLVHGKLRVPQGVIRAPLDRARVDRQKFAVSVQGRSAVTKYEVREFYSDFNSVGHKKLESYQKKLSIYQGFSLLNCWPRTGRTHQIRVHLQHWHHPLVGDRKYVGKKRAKLDQLWCPRQFLHAVELSLVHPRNQKQVSFQAELAVDLRSVLKLLSLNQ